MSRETPNAYHASFVRKSLAAVSRMGQASPPHVPAPSFRRKSTLQSHRIFSLSLSALDTSRLGPKTNAGGHKHTNLSPIDPNGSLSLDEDDSMYNEQDSLEMDTSATDLDTKLLSAAHAPPGLPRPPRYPTIVSAKRVPRRGVTFPDHWAPGGSCDTVRIEPPPSLLFQSRDAPSCWLLDGPDSDDAPIIERYGSESSGLDQDDTYGTISASASESDAGAEGPPDGPPRKDPIHAQLEHILEMDDVRLDIADLPGVPQSVWATCPTPPPSPNSSRPTQSLNRKTSYALLNYLLLDCGYDLAALRRLEARFPVPRPEPVDDECAHRAVSPSAGNTLEDIETPNDEEGDSDESTDFDQMMGPTLDNFDDPIRTVTSVLEEILQSLDAEAAEEPIQTLDAETTEERESPAAGQRSPSGLSLEAAAFISRFNARLNVFEEFVAEAALSFDRPSLTRSRSLPECWRMSAFNVLAPSPPPSPTPAPKQKPKTKLYLHGQMITLAESLAAPLQSGHAYLRDNMTIKNKVKTRPADTATATATVRQAPVISQGVPLQRTVTGGTLKKTSILGSFRHNQDERGGEPQKKWFARLSKLTKQTAEGMRVLVKGSPNARELPWKDFIKVMVELGFSMTEPEGNSVKFTPPSDNDPTITFHRPHDKILHVKHLTKIRRALKNTYGWIPEEIIAALG
ncbi:hypothetical protein C8R45DRAFT_980663 [Mycena sanguinolenta]|nr:hypothetical protein C8R45DRAFT_980663 [Mycena sanguinolenta]